MKHSTVVIVHSFSQRAWKNHLRTCQPDNQVIFYQTLCILIAEPSVAKFNELLGQFIQHWEEKETAFIRYFINTYSSRPGEKMNFNTL